MKTGQIATVVGALVVIAGSAALIVTQLGPEGEPPDPTAVWVCDHCGRTERAPLENKSADCPACTEGQMVQRVFFRCQACRTVFEAYQTNWSPRAERAADLRSQADAHEALAPECEEDPLLVRPSGGTWQWLDCTGGEGPFFTIRCPHCGKEGKRREFEMVLDPVAP